MATKDISDYSAVVTPAIDDDLLCQQNGLTRAITTTKLLESIKKFSDIENDDLNDTDLMLIYQSGLVKGTITQLKTYCKSIANSVRTGDNYSAKLTYGLNGNTEAWTSYSDRSTGTYSSQCCSIGILNDSDTVLNLIVFGGYSTLNDCLEFDRSADSWTSMADVPTAIWQAKSSVIDGDGYLYGGKNSSATTLKTCYIYDYNDDSWDTTTDLPAYRYALGACTILGSSYICGGGSTTTDPTNTCYKYTVTTEAWTSKTNIPVAKNYHGFVKCGDKGYSISGNGGTGKEIYMYNPTLNTWTYKSDDYAARERFMISTIINSIYIDSGLSGGSGVAEIRKYIPSTDTLSSLTDFSYSSAYGTASTIM